MKRIRSILTPKKHKIEFFPVNPEAELLGDFPSPAVKSIPGWYKELPQTIEGKPLMVSNREANLSIKMCPPMLDAFSTGYVAKLNADIFVYLDQDGAPLLSWAASEDLARIHGGNISKGWAFPDGDAKYLFKFVGQWGVRTPKNVSLLITHPLNRGDLPFTSVSAVVDTDKYSLMDFSFSIRKGFTGVIPAGTPIAQLIPFTRKNWVSYVSKYTPTSMDQWRKLNKSVMHHYKRFIWVKKTYQ